ncbi:MAG: aromatic ring hydroxylase [Nitrospinae bacterium RIFCSPLOWO2_12_39_16]|nr:MAG: aromatic ring hydroxylase [Nitrospinae bacterium RIFCSPLOWO2_02_39_17]OGW11655.1 MAG: aromatic ring hydroxylase [Nitrospinae bacterium RIFCSPLOWO2_12_39_16]
MIKREQILETLKNVIDPEIGINIADLGLVYTAEEKNGQIDVKMTMTTAACPMGSMLKDQAKNAIKKQFPDKTVNVELVWTPPWNPDMMSDDAKKKLGRL